MDTAPINRAPVVEKPEPIHNTELVTAFRTAGGHILHLRPKKTLEGWTKGITLAFKHKSSRIEMSTALQHRNDVFTKKNGTKVAIEHFLEGKTVVIPTVSNDFDHIIYQLKTMFNNW